MNTEKLDPGRRLLPKQEIIDRAIRWYVRTTGEPQPSRRRSSCKTVLRAPAENGHKRKLIVLRWRAAVEREVLVTCTMTNDTISFATVDEVDETEAER